jgi:hypothetical protein
MLVKPFPSKTHIGNHVLLHPETLTSQERTRPLWSAAIVGNASASDNVALS